MGVDERIKSSVFILGGGDIGSIVWTKRFHEEYAGYLEQVRATGDLDEVKPADDRFLFDPLTFAHLIRPRKVLMINARFDLIIPRKSTMKLWRALRQPRIIWIPATHITSCLWQGFICRRTVGFLKE